MSNILMEALRELNEQDSELLESWEARMAYTYLPIIDVLSEFGFPTPKLAEPYNSEINGSIDSKCIKFTTTRRVKIDRKPIYKQMRSEHPEYAGKKYTELPYVKKFYSDKVDIYVYDSVRLALEKLNISLKELAKLDSDDYLSLLRSLGLKNDFDDLVKLVNPKTQSECTYILSEDNNTIKQKVSIWFNKEYKKPEQIENAIN